MDVTETIAVMVRALEIAVQAAGDHVFPFHDVNDVHEGNAVQIPCQAASALGAADDFDEPGPFEFLGNLVGELPGDELFVADFPYIFQLPPSS